MPHTSSVSISSNASQIVGGNGTQNDCFRNVHECFTMRNMIKCAMRWRPSPAISAIAIIRRTGAAVPIVAVAVACSLPPHAPADPPIQPPTATVLRAVDGDTVDVRDDHRGRLRVRIAGIDTPELHIS